MANKQTNDLDILDIVPRIIALVVAVVFIIVGIYSIQIGKDINSSPYSAGEGNGSVMFGMAIIVGALFILVKACKAIIVSNRESKERQRLEAIEAEKKLAEQKKRQTEQDALLQKVKAGEWVFPSYKYYPLCSKDGINPMDGEYGLAKAKTIAESVITDSAPGIALQNFTSYLTKENIEKYYTEGQKIHIEETQRKNAQIYESSAFNSESHKIALAVKDLYGLQKRRFYLTRCLGGVKLPETVELIYEAPKERDWAVMGGIANGIAGPGAGVATALDTMRKNEMIRQQNEYTQNLMSEINGILGVQRQKAEERERRYIEQLNELDNKFVFSETSESILKHYGITVQIVSKRESYSDKTPVNVNLTIKQKQKYALKVPDHVKVILDGTLTGKLYVGDNKIADVIIPLPDSYNIDCVTTDKKKYCERTICAACTHYYGDPSAKYRFELDPNQNVWLMEA